MTHEIKSPPPLKHSSNDSTVASDPQSPAEEIGHTEMLEDKDPLQGIEDGNLESELAEPETEATPEEQITDLKDQLLRAMAEVENVRRRADRDRLETGKYAVTALARDLLTVADNLRRALESVTDEPRDDDILEGLLTGINMTERELLTAFDKHGIKRIDPIGEKFDHNFHQAMFELDNTGEEPGIVVKVVQPGYIIQDRLLRPAMVGIAKATEAVEPSDGDDTAT